MSTWAPAESPRWVTSNGAPPSSRGRRSAKVIVWILAVVLAAALVGAYVWRARPPTLPPGFVVANGRIEGDEILIASKRGGRVRELLVDEGDRVVAGQIVARLDDEELAARVDQARARIARAEAYVEQTRAALGKAGAAELQARRDAERFGGLAQRGTVSRLQGEQAALAAAAAAGDTAAASAAVNQAQSELAQARAQLAEARSARDDGTVTAPTAGTVTMRVRQPGEVVAAGAPLITLVDLDRLYLKAYVPESDIGKVHVGLPARLYTDAFPDRAVPATVAFVASRAEFTPKEVQTPDERVRLVFAIKLRVAENADRTLVPGMPADAVIRWQGDESWTRPRW